MDQQASLSPENSGKAYKSGDTLTFVAEFKQDIDPALQVRVLLGRDGGGDSSGLQWDIYLGDFRHVDKRRVEVFGQVGLVANGRYRPVRMDLMLASVTKNVSSNLDPDGDAAVEIGGNTGPSFPDLVDLDPKH